MSEARGITVLGICGSLRAGSYNKATLRTAIELKPPGMTIETADIGSIPLYNEDVRAQGFPPPVEKLRAQIAAADALLFVTLEYNYSMPGVLKNAIDVASRPYGQSVFNGKPGGVVSNSPGAIGGFGANHHLRQTLAFLNVPVLQAPEAYVGGIGDAFDANGELVKDSLKQFATTYINALAAWIDQVLKK